MDLGQHKGGEEMRLRNHPYWAYDVIQYAVEHGWVESRGEIINTNYDVPIRRAEAFYAAAIAFKVVGRNTLIGGNTYAGLHEVGEWTMNNSLGSYKFTSAGRTCGFMDRENWSVPEDANVDWNTFEYKFRSAVEYMYRYGFINGDTNGRINPINYLTRAEYAQIIYNIMYYDRTETPNPTHCSMANLGDTVAGLAKWYRAYGIGGTGAPGGGQFNG